jgi:hypothetical protein
VKEIGGECTSEKTALEAVKERGGVRRGAESRRTLLPGNGTNARQKRVLLKLFKRRMKRRRSSPVQSTPWKKERLDGRNSVSTTLLRKKGDVTKHHSEAVKRKGEGQIRGALVEESLVRSRTKQKRDERPPEKTASEAVPKENEAPAFQCIRTTSAWGGSLEGRNCPEEEKATASPRKTLVRERLFCT